MSIVTGIQTGLVVGLRTGINGQWLPLALQLRTQAQWQAVTGITLSNLYLCEDTATPLTDSIGSVDLAAIGTPGYRVTDPWSFGVSFDDNANDAFSDSANSFVDDGITSFAFGGISYLLGAPHPLGRHIAGSYSDSNNRYTVNLQTDGDLELIVGDDVSTVTCRVDADATSVRAVAWHVQVDRQNNLVCLTTTQGQSEASITGLGAFSTTTGRFRWGGYAASAAAQRLFSGWRCTGTNGELSAAAQSDLVAILSQGL